MKLHLGKFRMSSLLCVQVVTLLYSYLLYEKGQYFLDILYVTLVSGTLCQTNLLYSMLLYKMGQDCLCSNAICWYLIITHAGVKVRYEQYSKRHIYIYMCMYSMSRKFLPIFMEKSYLYIYIQMSNTFFLEIQHNDSMKTYISAMVRKLALPSIVMIRSFRGVEGAVV